MLYCDKCKEHGLTPVMENMYRKEFCENYHFSFFKPKKNGVFSARYERRNEGGSLSDAFKEQYEHHQRDKTLAHEEKSADKKRAQMDKSVYVARFDLQAVLTIRVRWCPSCTIHEVAIILQSTHLTKMFSAMYGMKHKANKLQKSQRAC